MTPPLRYVSLAAMSPELGYIKRLFNCHGPPFVSLFGSISICRPRSFLIRRRTPCKTLPSHGVRVRDDPDSVTGCRRDFPKIFRRQPFVRIENAGPREAYPRRFGGSVQPVGFSVTRAYA
jgi:hypothetical protein